ncbi:MAG: substrate-binding domain-containing protein [Candidatus Eisenbacteria bacterium]
MWWNKAERGARYGRTFPGSRIVLAILVVAFLLFIVWQGGRMRREIGPRTVTVYCFSALEEAMVERILPAFGDSWSRATGEHVEFITTFAGSGTITDRIIGKFPAEVAILSSEMDALRLVRRGVLPGPTWRTSPHAGVFARSPMVIRVREGNPRGISSFEDLAGEGVSLIQANPATSGAGEWAMLAVYGSELRASGDRERAAELLRRVWRNVAAEEPSARLLRARFEGGMGDAVITYEADALGRASQGGVRGEAVLPRGTIVSEPMIAAISRNVAAEQKALVDSLVAFFWSGAAQEILVEHGFRSVDEARNAGNPRFLPAENSFRLKDIGGAGRAQAEVLDKSWRESD